LLREYFGNTLLSSSLKPFPGNQKEDCCIILQSRLEFRVIEVVGEVRDFEAGARLKAFLQGESAWLATEQEPTVKITRGVMLAGALFGSQLVHAGEAESRGSDGRRGFATSN
jgi:hypothetical protein